MSLERFSEEITKVVISRHERDSKLMLFDKLSYVEMFSFNVFHPTVMFGVVGHVDTYSLLLSTYVNS